MRVQRSNQTPWVVRGLLLASLVVVDGATWNERFGWSNKEAAVGGGNPPPIEPGKCGVYRKGKAEISLCVESVVEYGADVQQVNAFLVNTGEVPVCDLTLKPVTSGKIYSFWPDWADKSSYEVYYTPKQVSAAGLTATPSNGPVSIDVATFRDCSVDGKEAAALPAAQFHTVAITTVQPKQPSGAEPSLMAGSEAEATAIPEGKCALYTKDDGSQLAHCIESIVRWGSDVVQVNAFLTNTGSQPICNLQLKPDESWTYYSVWPEWALTASWVNNFQVNQTTAVGATAPARPDHSYPSLTVSNFGSCNGDGGHGASTAKVTLVDLSTVMALRHGDKDAAPASGGRGWGFFNGDRRGGNKEIVQEEDKDVEYVDVLGEGHIVRYLKGRDERLGQGKCGVYTKPNDAEATLCLLSVEHYDDQTILQLTLANTGNATLCELGLTFDQDFTYIQIDPIWAQEDEVLNDYAPGTTVEVTVITEGKPNGFFPFVALDNFDVCGEEPPAKRFRPAYEKVPLSQLQTKKESRQLQGQNHAVPAGKCSVYKNGNAEIAICVDSIVQWGTDVQQLNGFLINTGKAPICNLKIAPVTGTHVLSFWPDWAENATWQVYFNPNQVSAVGLTAVPGTAQPYIDVVTFEPCGEKASGAVSFRTADVSDYQPILKVPATPSLMAGTDTYIPEGKCGVYKRGSGSMVLCIESIIQWGNEVVQINGFLENSGKDKLCNVKIGTAGADKYYSIWPEWVASESWVNDFQPSQVTAVGLTAPVKPKAGRPEIFLQGFDVCGQQTAGGVGRLVPDEVVDIAAIKRPVPLSGALSPSTGRRLAAEVGRVEPGNCGSFENGAAKLKLCVDAVQNWGPDVIQVAGELENIGGVQICDLRLGNTYGDAVYSSWPEWVANDRWENNFAPGQKIRTGFTAAPRNGHSANALSIVSFRDCIAAPSTDKAFNAITEGLGASVAKMLNSVRFPSANSHRSLADAAPKLAAPTTMETIKWDQCGYFKGLDGQSELALCWKDANTWNDKRKGRIVQANLILVNTGNFGVCNVSVYIENLDQETGDHYPNWYDDDGVDQFPNYPGYYAPKQIVNIGAAVPVAHDYPEVYVKPDFTACSPEPPKAPKPRNTTCVDYDKEGAQIKFCTYKDLKEWTDYKGPRYVMVEGYFENVGTSLVCNITVDIENFSTAKASWGEWMPNFPYKMSPGQVVKYGANIPFKKGFPKTGLSSYNNCGAPGTRRALEEEQQAGGGKKKEGDGGSAAEQRPGSPPPPPHHHHDEGKQQGRGGGGHGHHHEHPAPPSPPGQQQQQNKPSPPQGQQQAPPATHEGAATGASRKLRAAK